MAKMHKKPKRQRDEAEEPTSANYTTLLLLERLESLLEEMEELGVASREEIEARIVALHEQLDAGETTSY